MFSSTVINSPGKYRILWYLPILLSPLWWPWVMFIMATLVGVTQGFLEYTQRMMPKKVVDIANNPKKVGVIYSILFFIVSIISISTLVILTFSPNVVGFTYKNFENFVNIKYIALGFLWCFFVEAAYITFRIGNGPKLKIDEVEKKDR